MNETNPFIAAIRDYLIEQIRSQLEHGVITGEEFFDRLERIKRGEWDGAIFFKAA